MTTKIRSGQLDVGIGPNNVLALDSASKIPAVNGSQLLNLPGLFNIVEDQTPVLGGNLSVGIFSIIGTPGSASPSGPVIITGGVSPAASVQPGGNLLLSGGTGDGTANGGSVIISGGVAPGVGIGGSITFKPGDSAGTIPSVVEIEGAKTGVDQGELRLLDNASNTGAGGLYVGFKAPTVLTASQTYILPLIDGSLGDVLQTDGTGILSFIPISDLGEFTIATLPVATTHTNSYALATDAAGGRTIVRSNGTNWMVVVVEGAIVA